MTTMKDKLPLSDMDHPVWIFASGLFVVLVSFVMLFCTYQQWESPKDLATISAIAAAYFVAALSKRIIRVKQRENRENETSK